MLCVPCFCLVCWTNGGRSDRPKKTTADNQYLKFTSSGNAKKNPANTWHRTRDMHRALQLIHLLFVYTSSEMAWKGEEVKWRSHSWGKETGKAVCQIIQEPDWSSALTEEVQRRSGERYDCEGLEPPKKHGVSHGLELISAIGAKFNRIINAKRNHLILIHHTIPSWKTKNLPG